MTATLPEMGARELVRPVEARVPLRGVGQVPLAATVYSPQRFWCGARGGVCDEGSGRLGAGKVTTRQRGNDRATQVWQRIHSDCWRVGTATGNPATGRDQRKIVEEETEMIKPAQLGSAFRLDHHEAMLTGFGDGM